MVRLRGYVYSFSRLQTGAVSSRRMAELDRMQRNREIREEERRRWRIAIGDGWVCVVGRGSERRG